MKIVTASLLQCVAAGVWRQGADGEYEGECEFTTIDLCSRELSSFFCVWWLIREWMFMFVLQFSSPYCSARQLVPVGCNAHTWQNSGRWWQLREFPWFWDRERNSSRGLQMWSVIFICVWGVCKKVNDGERVWIQVRGVKLCSNLWVLLAFGCFPVQCCANSVVGHFMLVRGSVCASILGS
jgi:hypothetical protein